MTRQVSASIYGGQSYTVADQSDYQLVHSNLKEQSSQLTSAALAWGQAMCTLATHRERIRLCSITLADAHQQHSTNLSMGTATAQCTHTDRTPYIDSARELCSSVAAQCRVLAEECSQLADLIARAHSLYAEAELRNRALTNRAIAALTITSPGAVALVAGIFAAGGAAYGIIQDHTLSMAHISNATSWAQEGVISGIGGLVTKSTSFPLFIARTQGALNESARIVTPFTATLANIMQGNSIVLTQVADTGSTVGCANNMETALHNLRCLGQANANGDGSQQSLAYGTIAISQYKKQDGSSAWLVTIPGTDGKPDSPFGWEQNIELMSADATQRRNADSARMVASAMKEAGINSNDSVAVIGHSQGGIVAATLAADYKQEYNIEHVVTAGSPIANHPIDNDIWVTSIEMDDELVAALDGEANPNDEHWVTIRGTVNDAETESTQHLLSGRIVEDGDGPYTLTHDLKYHEAALGNALDLGSPVVQRHDAHFQSTIQGEYVGTTYWQGRMQY